MRLRLPSRQARDHDEDQGDEHAWRLGTPARAASLAVTAPLAFGW